MTDGIVISPSIFEVLAKFEGWKATLDKYLEFAGLVTSVVLVAGAQNAMNWQNPTGALSDSIHFIQTSATYFEIGSDLPYANRREYGFSGMTDSLGRYYANDPGAYYMQTSLDNSLPEAAALYEAAIEAALVELAAVGA